MSKKLFIPIALLIFFATIVCFLSCQKKQISISNQAVIRVAHIEIDSAQLDNYKAALKVGIETAVRTEAGVLTLYAVYNKQKPTQVTVFEVYADSNAYQTHIKTPHFLTYKTTTKNMVKSLELIDVLPIAIASK